MADDKKPDRSNVIAPGRSKEDVKPSGPRPPPGSKPTPVPQPPKKD